MKPKTTKLMIETEDLEIALKVGIGVPWTDAVDNFVNLLRAHYDYLTPGMVKEHLADEETEE